MTTISDRQSATIYQFPAGGRAALGVRRDQVMVVDNVAVPRIARVASGGAWYHEEAVQKADRARKM
jgi:Protein of unknown function (DUF2735)